MPYSIVHSLHYLLKNLSRVDGSPVSPSTLIMILAQNLVLVIGVLISLALADSPQAPLGNSPTPTLSEYHGTTTISQIPSTPSPWSPPIAYPSATVVGSTVGTNGKTTIAWRTTHPTPIEVPTGGPTESPCATWLVVSESKTLVVGAETVQVTDPILTASTIAPVTLWRTTTTTKTTTITVSPATVTTFYPYSSYIGTLRYSTYASNENIYVIFPEGVRDKAIVYIFGTWTKSRLGTSKASIDVIKPMSLDASNTAFTVDDGYYTWTGKTTNNWKRFDLTIQQGTDQSPKQTLRQIHQK